MGRDFFAAKPLNLIWTVVLLFIFLFAQFAPTAAALSEEQKDLHRKGIYYYDLEAACGGAGGGGSLRGSGKEAQIFNFLVDAGYTPEQAAGFVGNFYQESKLDPTIVNSIGATGLAQWLGARKTALFAFAPTSKNKSSNKSATSMGTQLNFVVHELKGSESAANSAIKGVKGSGTSALERVTVLIRTQYERPGEAEANDAARIRKALEVYEKYKDGGGSSAPASGEESGDTSTASSEEDCGEEGTGAGSGKFVWPVGKKYPVSSCYGSKARGRLHSGLDISAPNGTKIVAADGGTVTFAGASSGFGNTVVIKHGKLSTLYAHQKDGSIVVKKGDKVDQGQKIGEVNNTGSSFGDHLHFNIQKQSIPAYASDGSDTEDPLKHLPKDGRGISGGDCP